MPTTAVHANGVPWFHTHNYYGLAEAQMTYAAQLELKPNERPFILTRSSFLSTGTKAALWLGDNHSTWESFKASIQGILQFQLYGVPLVGSVCFPLPCAYS
jgi:alpha-glucosidase